ncbi:DEAD/DEAH box helicase [Vibrio alginolyticus]|uniref:DEAD/DEAH box helicase n=1 Tax=Vibrio diabolicus TaxID=50719 RepID=UPI00215E6718|nr:DEAD/DEAH box helicase [Vibrio diabolicus]EIZ9932923.1 DEAD/DEAH box helicase [Vibrio parahaemolyticus]ELB2751214.1 DEAD/DEAH box helicase [Vibrio alginolyticus]ELB2924811.1 DEAD/DEAH box helicase [Vibrio alginolyticus]MCS0334774.1 DEAD/DEAH box helicase [Vibrio diabolicus]HCG7963771.1 DEAD/DEAH box helicase [Vibrio parahaemolyticus]
MLKQIIGNLSSSDKFSLLTQSQKDYVEKLSSELHSEVDLTNMLYESAGLKLLLEERSRNILLQRMTPLQVREVIENVSIEGIEYNESDTRQNYEVLREISERCPNDFYRALGIGEVVEQFDSLKEKVQGTKKASVAYPLYDYQIDCADRIQCHIQASDIKRALLHLPTGAGKTRTAMNIVSSYLRSNPNSLVVWLADTRELCEQACDEFLKAWSCIGNHDLPVYSFYGDSELSISGITRGFLVAGLQKLHSLGRNDAGALQFVYELLRKNTSLVIFDEAHIAIAPTYKSIVDNFLNHSENNAFLVGLSATPGRVLGDDDNLIEENQRLSDFFENNKVTMKIHGYPSPLDYLVEKGYLAKAEFKQLNYDDLSLKLPGDPENARVDNSEVLKALSLNDNRNKKLLETIEAELANQSQIIVFACTVDHANELAMILAAKGIACRSIDGKTRKVERAVAISDYRNKKINVLINFGVLTAGFDAPCTNVAIIARPTNSLVQYSQMAGRAMRGIRSGGNEHCRVYTVNDNIPEFRSVCRAFEYWDQMWKPE